jgi:Phage major capsid protein E
MRTTSNRELARQLGVSETAVRRAEKAGRIHREADGGWDLGKVRAAWAGNTDPAQQRGGPSAREGSHRALRRAVKPVPEAALGAVRETLREHGEPAVDQQFARWVMLHVQSNPLPICTRPRVLIKGKRT